MHHVGEQEGSVFLSYRDETLFTEEEWEALNDILNDIEEIMQESEYSDYVYTGPSPSSLR